MATSPEKRIEAALISDIGALTYISANSVSVRADDDMSQEKTGKMVNVAVLKALRLEPNYNYYRSSVELGCITHIPNDENDTIGENIYDEVNNYVQALAASNLNAAVSDTEITVDGVVPMQNEDDYEDSFRQYVVRFDCFYTYQNAT